MSITRALQRAVQRPYCYPCAHTRTVAFFQGQVRFIASASAAIAPDQEPNFNIDINETNLAQNEMSRSDPRLSAPNALSLGGQAAKSQELASDLRKLNREVRHLHQSQIELQILLNGGYHVRRTANPQNVACDLAVKDNQKVFFGDSFLPNIWLRDNCQCSQCLHSETKQRLLDTFSIPKDIAIEEHKLDENRLNIKWSDGHQSTYTRESLGLSAKHERHKAVERSGLENPSLWDSSVASDPPKMSHKLASGPHIRYILERIRKYGFCYVDETPFETPDATEKFLKRISFIRETHYGGFYDFTADLASKDTAYTNIALEAHTDTTYFSDPAGLQAFHLLSHTDGEGGASLLVDGFKVASELLETDPEAYKILSNVNVYAHASGNEGISIQPYRGFPVLEHDPATGNLLRVRWNSSDRAGIQLPIGKVEVWYDAARKFDNLLKKKENEYWEQLKPGRVLIFDNWRVLHGRSKFTGKRRICGGYINRDDWISKYKMLKYGGATIL